MSKEFDNPNQSTEVLKNSLNKSIKTPKGHKNEESFANNYDFLVGMGE